MRTEPQLTYPAMPIRSVLKAIAFCISRPLWGLHFQGVENLPTAPEGFILASNHQTYLDPVWITLPIKRKLQFMALAKAFEWKWLGPLVRYLGAFPVPYEGRKAKDAYRRALAALDDGAALVIFPEGEREFADGRFSDFRSGAVRIARRSGAAIVPVTISGGNKVWPRGRRYPALFGRVTIEYHPAFRPGADDDEDTQLLREIVSSTYR